jgi:hypothetical protein
MSNSDIPGFRANHDKEYFSGNPKVGEWVPLLSNDIGIQAGAQLLSLSEIEIAVSQPVRETMDWKP